MLFSPLLNELNRKICLDKHFLFVCILLLFSWIYGGIFHDQLDANGKTIFHFIVVYEIGSLLRKCRNQKDQLCGRTKAWLYLIFCICIVFIFIRYRLLHIVDNLPFELYNNPFIIIGSVSKQSSKNRILYI